MKSVQLDECYAPGFWSNSKGLFQRLGYAGKPTSLQGLMRVWEGGSSMRRAAGVAQWIVVDNDQTSDLNQLVTHASLFQTHPLPEAVPTSSGDLSEQIFRCSQMEHEHISESAGLFTLPNLRYAEHFEASWVFAPQNSSITVLELRFIDFNLMSTGENSSTKGETGSNATNFQEYETLSFCRQRRESDRRDFLGLDPDKSGFIILSEFHKLRREKDYSEAENARLFEAMDADGDGRLYFEEWDGEMCQNFTASSPPSNRTRIRTPCTMRLLGQPMLPGFNWDLALGPHKFAFVYYPATGSEQMGPAPMAANRTTTILGPQQLWLSLKNQRSSGSMLSDDEWPHNIQKQNLPPCQIQRATVSDDYSTLLMSSHSPPADALSLRGAWSGTCNPSVLYTSSLVAPCHSAM